jgi:hypothetical protein
MSVLKDLPPSDKQHSKGLILSVEAAVCRDALGDAFAQLPERLQLVVVEMDNVKEIVVRY